VKRLILLHTLLFSAITHAILDTNNNGLSDLWEKQYNDGQLFSPTNPEHQPNADPDQDGWNNLTEAAAGTDPSLANPPEGIVANTLLPSATIGAYTLTWPTRIGKRYQLQASTDMESWLPVGEAIIAENTSHSTGINVTEPGSPTPPKLFWHLLIDDIDSDSDGLSNNEEHQLATDPNAPDSDGDNLFDGWEVVYGMNPNDDGTVNVSNGANGDPDNDGAINSIEQNAGSSPTNTASTPSDIDGDGLLNDKDADPKKILIDWERAHEGSYVVIDLEMQPLTANSTQHGRSTVPAVLNDNNNICREPVLENGEKTPATWDTESFPVVWNPLANFSNVSNAIQTFNDFTVSFNNSQHTYHGHHLDDGSDDSPGPRAITVKWGGLNSAPSRYGNYSTQHTHRLVESRFNQLATEERIYHQGTTPLTITSTLTAPGFSITATSAETTDIPSIDWFNLYSAAPQITRTGKILVHQNGGVKINDITPPSNIIYGITADPHDNTLVAVPGAAGEQSVCTKRHRNGNWELMPMPGIMDMNAGGVGITFPEHQVWRNGKTVNLDELLSGSGWENFKAEQINEKGSILGSAMKIGQSEFLPVLLVPVEVVPDYNRDGMINDGDRGKVTKENPLVFWINDDDDSNDQPHFGDIPGSQVDCADMLLNDARDLVDFFPVQLLLKEILTVLPADKYTYKIFHPTGAFHFIEMPDVHPESSPEAQGAGAYLRNSTMADEALARPMLDTAGQGTELTAEYLNAAKDGKGVLLFEAKSATNQSFVLIISKKYGGAEIARIARAMPVEIVDVEKMFWRANIRPAAYGQTPGAIQEPESTKFKATRKDRWFVFCHGYNVSEEAAGGWNAEVFKRLHQMGSDSKFFGVTWEGNQGRLGDNTILPFEGGFVPDYWRNVYNAFSSSHALATLVNGLSGGGKVVAGHSLGNMLMGSAICDKGLNAEKYFMLNPAVPREAYFPNHIATDRTNVRNPTFQPYPTRLWSSDWKTLFTSPGDGRAKLTWQGRFGDLATKTTPHNYYSTGEDVAKSGNGTYPNLLIDVVFKGESAWISQEMNKGLAVKAFITGAGTGNWSANGGWEFNPNHYQQYRPNPLDPPGGTLPDTAAITNAQLMANPFFKPFTKLKIENGGAVPDSEDGIVLTGPQGSAHAANYAVKAWLLAHDVPAISQPAASNPINGIAGDDMNDLFKTGNWGNPGNWKHSDLKDQPLDGVWKLFKDMVTRGDLKK